MRRLRGRRCFLKYIDENLTIAELTCLSSKNRRGNANRSALVPNISHLR